MNELRPHVSKETAEADELAPNERVQQRTVEVPMPRAAVDIPVPPVMEQRPAEHIMDESFSPILQESSEAVQSVLR